ncbi:hypothetical protein LVJ94_50240 [Pendulispora rubella]|uniref:Uncharacterized protein n=1 Tax=Pendulispora rubella TaxID=2741070 RepID=A0ABZ2L2B0_9BACT
MTSRSFVACISFLLVACLDPPGYVPGGRYMGPSRECGAPNELPFDDSCRQRCNVTHDCPINLWCTYTGRYDRVCLDYPRCGYLDSDTECAPAVVGDPTSCAGNAQWRERLLSGDPACGVAHQVRRCQPTPDGCALVEMTTYDIGTP